MLQGASILYGVFRSLNLTCVNKSLERPLQGHEKGVDMTCKIVISYLLLWLVYYSKVPELENLTVNHLVPPKNGHCTGAMRLL